MRLLPLVTPENWRLLAGAEETVADLFAGLIADLELASSPPATPRFAVDFIRRRIARKLSNRYSSGGIGTELERRYERAAQAVADEGRLAESSVVLQRLRTRLARLRERLEV